MGFSHPTGCPCDRCEGFRSGLSQGKSDPSHAQAMAAVMESAHQNGYADGRQEERADVMADLRLFLSHVAPTETAVLGTIGGFISRFETGDHEGAAVAVEGKDAVPSTVVHSKHSRCDLEGEESDSFYHINCPKCLVLAQEILDEREADRLEGGES